MITGFLLTDRSSATHASEADPADHITAKEFDKDGNAMPTAHYPVKKTGEKAKVDEKAKDEGKK
jgi:hypothetical protein